MPTEYWGQSQVPGWGQSQVPEWILPCDLFVLLRVVSLWHLTLTPISTTPIFTLALDSDPILRNERCTPDRKYEH